MTLQIGSGSEINSFGSATLYITLLDSIPECKMTVPRDPEAEESCEEEDEEEEGSSGSLHKQIFIQELLLASLSLGRSLEDQEERDGCES
jgi:hypothetical protein